MTHEESRKLKVEIAAYVVAGHSVPEASARFRVPRDRVYSACAQAGINYRALKNSDRSKLQEKIASYITSGHTAKEAASHFNTTLAAIYRGCVQEGVNYKTPRFSSYAILADLINTQDSMREIGARRRVTGQAVQQVAAHAREAGIQLHPIRRTV